MSRLLLAVAAPAHVALALPVQRLVGPVPRRVHISLGAEDGGHHDVPLPQQEQLGAPSHV